MRGYYLKKSDSNQRGGSRGGVGADNEFGDYDLEIGNSQNADHEMVALCVMIDEVREFLKVTPSPLAKLILHKWEDVTADLRKQSSDVQF